MVSYKKPQQINPQQFYGEGIKRVIKLNELNMPAVTIPFVSSKIPAGKPMSPFLDEVQPIRFPYNFFPRPERGYIIEVEGDSMVGSNIDHGDILFVDGSAQPKNRDIVLASINGEMTVKRFLQNPATYAICFEPTNKLYEPIHVRMDDDVDVIGVVIKILKTPI